MAGARGRLASAFGGAASEEFDQCDLDGDGKITGRAEAEALRNLVVSGQPGLIATPRQWTDPLVISNVLFALAALQWWCRGYRLQGALLFGCAVVCNSRRCVACANHAWRADLLYRYAPIPFISQASSVYHSSGEDQSHWSLIVDQLFAYVTFAHTVLRTAMQLHRASVPGLCGLIATALLVYCVAVPLRGHHNGARGPYTTAE